MYSQHDYRQNHQVDGWGSTTMASTQQLAWNGREWVPQQPGSSGVGQGVGARTSAPFAEYNRDPGFGETDAAEKVSLFSEYYQQWTAQATEARMLARSLPDESADKKEAERRAAWAEYFAHQSSRCAHYHNDRQKGIRLSQPPPEAPPAPPAADRAPPQRQQSLSERNFSEFAKKKPARWGEPQSCVNGDESPESLKRYVHRCLSRCVNEAERNFVRQEIEKVIGGAVSSGSAATIDWDSRALINPMSQPQNEKGRISFRSYNIGASWKNMQLASDSSHSPQPSNSDSLGSVVPPRSISHSSPSSFSVPSEFPHANPNFQSREKRDAACGDSGQPLPKPLTEPHKEAAQTYDESLPHNNSYYGRASSDEANFGFNKFSNFLETPAFKNSSSPTAKKTGKRGPMSDLNVKKKTKSKKTAKVESKKVAKSQKTANAKFPPTDGFLRSSSVLAKRADRFAGKGGLSDTSKSGHSNDTSIHKYMGMGVIGGHHTLDEADYERMTVKGTCQVLEKEYLRLTAPPRADLVRPKAVLQCHLLNLKRMWGQRASESPPCDESSPKIPVKKDYLWFCSQFKAVRQDLTVQRINDAFAVDVYETHARIALEEGDLNEYNQCQTQLKELYNVLAHSKHNEKSGTNKGEKTGLENLHEFIAYRIIYYVFLTGNEKYDGGSSDLTKIMLSLTPQQKTVPCIAHALKVRIAFAECDYHSFFRLLNSCPNMGSCLMECMVPGVRQGALQRIQKSYRPSVCVRFVLREIGFQVDSSSTKHFEEGKNWLLKCGCKLDNSGEYILTKESIIAGATIVNKKGSLI